MRIQDRILLEKAYQTVQEMAYGISDEASNQKMITKAELVEIIKKAEQDHPGATFVGITQITKETTKVAPFPRFILPGLKDGRTYFAKVSQVGGQIGFDYGASENRAREKQGLSTDFKPQASIYSKEEGSAAIERLGDQLYLYYRPLHISKTFTPVIVKAKKDLPNTGEDFDIVTKEQVQEFKSPPPPSAGSRFTVVRKISIDGIAAIKINKQEYFITDLDPIRKAIYEASGAPKPPDVDTTSGADTNNEG